jgi:hypothetical protein
MSDLNRTQTFEDGDLVTASKLKNLIDQTTINPTFISGKDELVASGLDKATDTVLIHDFSTGSLKKVKIEELLVVPVSLPVLDATDGNIETLTTSVIDGQANKGLLITPNDGQTVSGVTWVSSDGLTVTVTSTAHGLTTGAVLIITASNTAYSADTAITVTSVDQFTYTLAATNPARVASAGTISYYQKAYVVINGRLVVAGKAVLPELKVTGNLESTGTATLGAATVTSLLIGGKTPMTTQDNQIRIYTKSGVTSGKTGAGVDNLIYETPTLTIPTDETWIYEFLVQTTSGYVNGNTRADFGSVYMKVFFDTTLAATLYGSTSPYGGHTATFTYAATRTSANNGSKITIKTLNWWGLNTEPYYQIKLTKVKTSTLSDASSCI